MHRYITSLIIIVLLVIGAGRAQAEGFSYGDSNTAGTIGISPSDRYVNKLATLLGVPIVNRGVNGSMAGELSTAALTLALGAGDFVTGAVGINDQRIYGTGVARRAAFVDMMRSFCLAVVAPQRVRAVDAAMTKSGPWTATPGYLGAYVDGVASASVQVSGSTVWVGYIVSDWSGAHSRATVKIDGAFVGEIVTDAGGVGISTQNGLLWAPAAKAYALPTGGPHTVEITTTVPGQRFYLEFVAGSDQPSPTPLYLSNIPRMSAAGYAALGGSDQNVADYNAAIASLVNELQLALRSVTLVESWSVINPLTDLQPDGIHENAGGHTILANKFFTTIVPPQGVQYGPATIQVGTDGNYYAVKADGSGRVKILTAP